MTRIVALALALASTLVGATPAIQPSKVERSTGHTEYQFPVDGDKVVAPLVIVVPDTTVPLQQIVITNRTAPATPPPVKIAGSLEGAVLPGGVKNAQEALSVWPFAAVLEAAEMIFMAPETVKLEKSVEASLVIDMSKYADKLQKELAGSNKKGEKIEITRVVVAKILAPGFSVIEVVSEGRQVLNLSGPTEWRWTLTPKKLGDYKVNVTVSAVVQIGSDRAERLVKIFDQEVNVYVTPADAAKFFFTKNWQWLWSVMIMPFGLWFWKSRKKKLVEDQE